MSTFIPKVALGLHELVKHLAQVFLNLISSAECCLYDLLRIFSHFTPLEPACRGTGA